MKKKYAREIALISSLIRNIKVMIVITKIITDSACGRFLIWDSSKFVDLTNIEENGKQK